MAKKYVINKASMQVVEDIGNLGASYRSSEWRKATALEVSDDKASKKKKADKEVHDRSISVEDMLEKLIDHAEGTPLDQETKDWALQRKALRDS